MRPMLVQLYHMSLTNSEQMMKYKCITIIDVKTMTKLSDVSINIRACLVKFPSCWVKFPLCPQIRYQSSLLVSTHLPEGQNQASLVLLKILLNLNLIFIDKFK